MAHTHFHRVRRCPSAHIITPALSFRRAIARALIPVVLVMPAPAPALPLPNRATARMISTSVPHRALAAQTHALTVSILFSVWEVHQASACLNSALTASRSLGLREASSA